MILGIHITEAKTSTCPCNIKTKCVNHADAPLFGVLYARWSSQLAFMVRLVILEVPIAQYLRDPPQSTHRALTPTELIVLKEVCCVLEYAKRVTVGIQGGSDGILSRSIFLCHELVNIYSLEELEYFDFRKIKAAKVGEEPVIHDEIAVAGMQDASRKAVSVGLDQLRNRKVHTAESDVELIALYLDPRYKTLDETVCGNGDMLLDQGTSGTLLKKAKEANSAMGKAMDVNLASSTPSSSGEPNDGDDDSAAGSSEPASKRGRTLFESREHLRHVTMKRNMGHQSATASVSVSTRLQQEMVSYDYIAPVAATQFDVVGYWRSGGRPTVDKDGVVIEGPKFPLLSLLARIYLGIDSTSCQSERDFSVLATTLNKLRCSMDAERVRKMMFSRLNSNRIKEISDVNPGMEGIRAGQEEARKQAAEAQQKGAGEIVVLD